MAPSTIIIDSATTTASLAQQLARLYAGMVTKVGLRDQPREILSADSAKMVTGLAFGEKQCSIGFISRQGEGANVHSFALVLVRVPEEAYYSIRATYSALNGDASDYRGTYTYDITPQEVWWPVST